MAGEIAVTIVGNVTDEPELRFTPAGRAVVVFTVASTERKSVGTRWEDGATTFLRVSAWGSLAENAAESLAKGTRVVVAGVLRQRNYDTAEGDRRAVFEVTADEVGPSLKWASAQVRKVSRSTSVDSAGADVLTEGEKNELAAQQQKRTRKTA